VQAYKFILCFTVYIVILFSASFCRKENYKFAKKFIYYYNHIIHITVLKQVQNMQKLKQIFLHYAIEFQASHTSF